jgi:hypothetical protein
VAQVGRVLALQPQSPDFKTPSQPKKKKKESKIFFKKHTFPMSKLSTYNQRLTFKIFTSSIFLGIMPFICV